MGARGGTGGGGGGGQGLQLVQNNLITVTPAKEVIEYTASPVCTRILRIVLATSTAVYRFLRPQALVYAILPSTTAVFIYVVGSRKLSASEQFFCWCSNRSKFVTKDLDNIRRLFYVAYASSNKSKIV